MSEGPMNTVAAARRRRSRLGDGLERAGEWDVWQMDLRNPDFAALVHVKADPELV